jgi:hypothetical protein
MTTSKYLRVGVLIAAALAASGCGVFKKGKHTNTPVLGQRIAVLTGEGDVTVDPATATLPMNLPAAVANTDWTQSGGNQTKSMGQLALGNAAGEAFVVQAGRGSSLTARLRRSSPTAGSTRSTLWVPFAPSMRVPGRWRGQVRRLPKRAPSGLSTAAESPTTTAGFSRRTGLALSRRWTSATAASCGRSVPADRCAARRPSLTAPSTS